MKTYAVYIIILLEKVEGGMEMKKALLSVVVAFIFLLASAFGVSQASYQAYGEQGGQSSQTKPAGGLLSSSFADENVLNFVKELYQVEEYQTFEQFMENYQAFLHNINQANPNFQGIIPIEDKDGEELFKPFLDKYQPYCSQNGIKQLIQWGYINKFDQLAYENKCKFLVKDIKLTKDANNQYYYTAEVEIRGEDGNSVTQKSEGIVQVNEEGYVDRYRITNMLNF